MSVIQEIQFLDLFLKYHNVNALLTREIPLIPRNIINPSIYLGLRYDIALRKYLLHFYGSEWEGKWKYSMFKSVVQKKYEILIHSLEMNVS